MASTLGSLITSLALAVALGGCSSSYKAGSKASDSITATAQQMESGHGLIDATVASLNKLTGAPAGADLRPLFKEYSNNVDKLDSTAKSVKKRAEEMKAKGQAYFKDWDAQVAKMHNEDIKTRSADRRASVETSFQNIRDKYQAVGDAYRPLMSDFQDIRTALDTDLTPGGVGSVKSIAARIGGEAAKVKEAVSKLSTEFRALGVQMSPRGN